MTAVQQPAPAEQVITEDVEFLPVVADAARAYSWFVDAASVNRLRPDILKGAPVSYEHILMSKIPAATATVRRSLPGIHLHRVVSDVDEYVRRGG